jgi:hypothetical protein
VSGPNIYGTPKQSSTADFTNVDNPTQTTGTLQCGSWADLNVPPPSQNQRNWEILQGVPAQTRVQISGTGVTQVGGPNQFRLQTSIGEGSVQLTGHVTDATNVNTDPPLGTFVWISRNTNVATVNSSGMVMLVGRGECDIECRYSRSANLPFANASPSPTESMSVYATVAIVVTA